jgi:hypothetical protein
MRGPAIRGAFPKPEKQSAIGAKAFEIGVSRRPVLTVEIETLVDAERGQRRLIKRDGAFHIAYGEKNVVQHPDPFSSFG